MPAPLSGQTAALSGTAQPLSASQVSCTAFTIKAPASNVRPAFVGAAGVTLTTGFQLDPGDEITYERNSQAGQASYQLAPSDFYAVGTSPDIVTWLASPA